MGKNSSHNNLRDRDYWKSIWLSFKNGDQESFGKIYNSFIDILYSYGTKLTSDRELIKDAVQDLFIDLYKYDIKLKNPEYLEFYLIKSLKHQILNRIKTNNKYDSLFDPGTYTFSLKFDLEEEYIQNESDDIRNQSIKEMVQQLDPQKRELLFLKFNTGLNYSEIGLILNIKPDAVKKQIYRLLDQLRIKYGEKLLELFFVSITHKKNTFQPV